MERKIISEIIVGSTLYGTNRPDSDLDIKGVFLPSQEDLLGLQNCPTTLSKKTKLSTGPRNTAGDTDREFKSLKTFLREVTEGQSTMVELLFAPKKFIVKSSPEWNLILKNRHIFLSQNSIVPFLRFAKAQAMRCVLKGDNLRKVQALLVWGETLTQSEASLLLSDWLPTGGYGLVKLGGVVVEFGMNDFGAKIITIAGRGYDENIKTRVFLNSLKVLEEKYGTRSREAAGKRYDSKSLMHAYRLLGQAEELLKSGDISFPRPDNELEFLKIIRDGDFSEDYDFLSEIDREIERIHQIAKKSILPTKPNWSKVEALCQKMHSAHLIRKWRFPWQS